MYYSMMFVPNEFGLNSVNVLPVRSSPFKSKEAAIRAITKKNVEGYVKQPGVKYPIWSNVK